MRLEQVTAEGDYSLALWADEPFRDIIWGELRDQLGTTIPGREHQTVTFIRYVTDPQGRAVTQETSREHADMVRLRLACWADPDGPPAATPAPARELLEVVTKQREPGVDCARCKGMMFRHPGCHARGAAEGPGAGHSEGREMP